MARRVGGGPWVAVRLGAAATCTNVDQRAAGHLRMQFDTITCMPGGQLPAVEVMLGEVMLDETAGEAKGEGPRSHLSA